MREERREAAGTITRKEILLMINVSKTLQTRRRGGSGRTRCCGRSRRRPTRRCCCCCSTAAAGAAPAAHKIDCGLSLRRRRGRGPRRKHLGALLALDAVLVHENGDPAAAHRRGSPSSRGGCSAGGDASGPLRPCCCSGSSPPRACGRRCSRGDCCCHHGCRARRRSPRICGWSCRPGRCRRRWKRRGAHARVADPGAEFRVLKHGKPRRGRRK